MIALHFNYYETICDIKIELELVWNKTRRQSVFIIISHRLAPLDTQIESLWSLSYRLINLNFLAYLFNVLYSNIRFLETNKNICNVF